MAEPKTAAKKTTTRARRGPKRDGPIAVLETKMVPLDELQLYHANPRIGNIDAIAASLKENGQYKPIVVNIGTHTELKNEILAGNHTYLGMKANGEKNIYASFVDVDDTRAKKIVLADNKTADLGEYDEKIIADLFKSLPDIAGTGYSTEEYEDLLASVGDDFSDPDVDVDDLLSNVNMDNEDYEGAEQEDLRTEREKYKDERAERDADKDYEGKSTVRGDGEDHDEDDRELVKDAPVDKLAELQVVLEIKEDNVWKNPNDPWGIPAIPEHAILKEFPKDVVTWIGHQYTEQKPGRYYFYNYSLGGTKGLDMSKAILAFNTYDYKFMSWWDTPSYNLARHMVKGLKIAVVPDFSYYYTETRVHHLWGVYRANWLGRFFAEAGLQVIPRLQWDFRDPNYQETALAGVPLNSPTLECSIQNINEEQDRKLAKKQLREMLEHLKPENFIVYGGNPAMRMVSECGWKGKTTHILSYANARRESGAYDKKEGAAGLTAKQKKELREKYGATEKSFRQDGEDTSEFEDEFEDDE
ncbi:ParB-like nuclease domain protein [Gordonia phage ChisanaKitsune]|uniref:ParB-like nuclease domain protein n=1 Tax=Gordonia phage ChisanaKitsune TaxID=2871538 RepID=A0AAE8C1A8_9CAUD|nr:ParB-like nuclease domain protein [Gordonia phage ChisanaKitsune]QZE10872.1 ParB-like nuclease domain protein [Gordonia phage ChisanaKitsune]